MDNKEIAAKVLAEETKAEVRFYTYEGEDDEGLSYYLTPESPEFNDKFIYVEFSSIDGLFIESLIDLK